MGFIMKGAYDIAFFDLVRNADGKIDINSPHWHKLECFKNLEKLRRNQSDINRRIELKFNRMNVVNDFSVFSAIKSDIGYLCTEDVSGYSITHRVWAQI